jgi:hypothetical protein
MHGPPVDRAQRSLGNVADREVRHRVARRLEQEDDVVASSDDAPTELDAHSSAQRLEVKHPLGHRGCGDECSVGIAAQRSLLP